MAKARNTRKLDTMSITVLLVMAIFGGIVGYYIGRASLTNQLAPFRESVTMMDSLGKMMEQRGTRYGDRELRDGGRIMMEKGGMMNSAMETMMKGY